MLVYQRVWLDMYPILFVLHILIVQWKIHQISPGARLTLDVPNRIKLHMYIYIYYIYIIYIYYIYIYYYILLYIYIYIHTHHQISHFFPVKTVKTVKTPVILKVQLPCFSQYCENISHSIPAISPICWWLKLKILYIYIYYIYYISKYIYIYIIINNNNI